MNVLITGHKGFVGQHFQKKLKRHTILGIDIADGNDCRDFFRTSNKKFDLVIHLAAVIGGRETIEGHPIEVATDLSMDAELFNWAIRTNQKRIIYYSSSAAYPIHLQQKKYKLKESDINLADIRLPDYTYGWAKLTGEMLAVHAKKRGVNVHVFRPFSGYGEDQDEVYPFPSFINRIKNQEIPFTIWGDGRQVRDFIHIDDIVSATMKAVELDIQEPINLGWGRPISFNRLARIMFDVAGITPPRIEHKREKPVGVFYRCSDNTKMLSFYTPKISIEEGIVRALHTK